MEFNEPIVSITDAVSDIEKIAMMQDGEDIDYSNLPVEKFMEIFIHMTNPDSIVRFSRVNKNAMTAAMISADDWLRKKNLPRAIPALMHWLVQSPFWKFAFPQLTYRQKIAAIIQMKGKISVEESRRLIPEESPEVLMAAISEMHNENRRIQELLPMTKKIRMQVTQSPEIGGSSFLTMETFFYSELFTPNLGKVFVQRINELLNQLKADEGEDVENRITSTVNQKHPEVQNWHLVGVSSEVDTFLFVYDDDTEMAVSTMDIYEEEPLEDEVRILLRHNNDLEIPLKSWVTYGMFLKFPDLNSFYLKRHDWQRFVDTFESYRFVGKPLQVNLPDSP